MIRQWIVDKDDIRIDHYAWNELHISHNALKNVKMNGKILVNNIEQTVRYHLHFGDVLTFIYPDEINDMEPYEFPLKIVYEDDYLLIIDKPKGIACLPTKAHYNHSLANILTYYYNQINLHSTIHFVNRLDKDTSGLMIIAKYREIHDLMIKDFNHIYRIYQAHVEGCVDKGTITLPIYKNNNEMKRIIDERGVKAITHYQCLSYKDNISLVRFRLETGRTHQIRVHMSAIGHPLVGDEFYGSDGNFDLDSVMVAFTHPVTKQIITIQKKCSK